MRKITMKNCSDYLPLATIISWLCAEMMVSLKQIIIQLLLQAEVDARIAQLQQELQERDGEITKLEGELKTLRVCTVLSTIM